MPFRSELLRAQPVLLRRLRRLAKLCLVWGNEGILAAKKLKKHKRGFDHEGHEGHEGKRGGLTTDLGVVSSGGEVWGGVY